MYQKCQKIMAFLRDFTIVAFVFLFAFAGALHYFSIKDRGVTHIITYGAPIELHVLKEVKPVSEVK